MPGVTLWMWGWVLPPQGAPLPGWEYSLSFDPLLHFLSCHQVLLPFPWNASCFPPFPCLPVSSSPSTPHHGKGWRSAYLWGLHHTRLLFSNYHCQPVTPLLRSCQELPASCGNRRHHFTSYASSFRTSLHCVCSALFLSSHEPPKAQSLLWVCSVNQPCFLYGSPAPKRFPCLSKYSPFLGQIQIPPPSHCFPYYSSDNPMIPFIPQLFLLMH